MAGVDWDKPQDLSDANRVNRERAAAAQARREEVLRLRAAGMTLAQIGAALGVSRSRAGQLHAEGLAYREKLRRLSRLTRHEDVNADTRTGQLPFSDRLRHALKSEGIETFGELFGDSHAVLRRLLRAPNINRKGIEELMGLLTEAQARARHGDQK